MGKLLIIGGSGMLGHRLWSSLSSHHDVFGTIRGKKEDYPKFPEIKAANIISEVDILNSDQLKKTLNNLRPDYVLNAVGIIKQIKASKNRFLSTYINSFFPHQLANFCEDIGAKMIHFSTDCVFDGKMGNYKENDFASATDLYGRSKFLGEIPDRDHVLTLRTSIIGRELTPKGSLIDWFLSQKIKGEATGFANAIYSGFPTYTIAKIIDKYILGKDIHGLYHLSSEPIDKYTLLNLVKKAYNLNITIHKDENFVIDRSLDSSLFQKITNFKPMPWTELVQDLLVDKEFYS